MVRVLTVILFICLAAGACRKGSSSPPPPPPPPPHPNDSIETQHILREVNSRINMNIGGYYEALPSKYPRTTKKYPLLISFHGAGQFGGGTSSDLPRLLNEGVMKVINQKKFPSNFPVNGQNFSFIVVAPQFQSTPSIEEVRSFIDYVKSTYRVDLARIYLTGFSIGGLLTCNVASEYPTEFAAIVPMAGEIRPHDKAEEKCKNIAEASLAVWDFHCDNDLIYNVAEAYNFVTLINKFNPPIPPKLTILPSSGDAGHDAWSAATDPLFKENNRNIYEWMLSYNR